MGFLDSMMGGMDTYGTNASEEEKRRAFQYAVRGFGQGLMKGAFSNQPGAVGMGLSEGLNNFSDGWRGSLESDEKKRIDRQKNQNALDLDQLQLEGARQNITEGQDKARDRVGKTQGIKAWSSAMADNVQEAEEYLDNQKNPDPEFNKYWKGRFKQAASIAERAIQIVDGKEVALPEFAADAMKVFDEYEKATGDLALRQTVLDRTDESTSRHLGKTKKDPVTGIERGDIEWFRAEKAKMDMQKDQLGIQQQKANIAYTQEGITDRREDKSKARAATEKDLITNSQLMKLTGEAESELNRLFKIVHVPGNEDEVIELSSKWGITNPIAFHKSWQKEENRQPFINALAIHKQEVMESARGAMKGQNQVSAPTSNQAPPDPMKVRLGVDGGNVSKADAIRDLQARGLTEPQIRQLYPFLF